MCILEIKRDIVLSHKYFNIENLNSNRSACNYLVVLVSEQLEHEQKNKETNS